LLRRAQHEWERARADAGREPFPFFLILDEMNLAHVEHYFSDVLSCLESGQALELHQDPAAEEGEGEAATPVPQRLGIPENLFFIGTVNVDETTYMFSPKVLDRAFTIELNQVNLRDWGNGVAGVEPAERSPLRLNRFAGTLGRWRRPGAEDWQAFG